MSESLPAPVELNPQQQAAVACAASVLVLAGAGTGKTRVIVTRITRLLAEGVAPGAILAMTYTNKASGEMRTRLGPRSRVMFVCTFHSLCLRLLRAHHELAGLPSNFLILDNTEQTTLVRRVLQEDMGLPKPAHGGPEPRGVCNLINSFKAASLRPRQVTEKMAKREVREAYDRYETRRGEEGKADFAELLLRAQELLQTEREVRDKWSQRFSHILIDELQDINALQLAILGLLQRPETVFFGVGDDDQSIYRFRGAMPRMLRIFAQEFTDRKVLHLERNYRSTDTILALANAIISRNPDRLGKTLSGTVGRGELPTLTRYGTEEEEANSIGRELAGLRDRGATLSEIALFYRNHSLSQLVEASLSRHGVPFQVQGGLRFFARAEIRDALAYLQAAAQPDNLDAILRSVNNPPRKVGPKAKAGLTAAARQGPLWDLLAASDHAGLRAYVQVVEKIRACAQHNDLVGAAAAAIRDSGLQAYLVGRNEHERAENLDEIINAAARFQELEDGNLDDFLNLLTLDQELANSDDQVSLMTIHAAKGLEFNRIYLIGLEDSILPGWQPEPEQLAEERRLLYVAVTRARQQLCLSFADQRRQRGFMQKMWRTRLLNWIDPQLLRLVGNIQLAANAPPAQEGKLPRQPPPANLRQTAHGLRVGQKVRSKKFGTGVIIAVEGSGDKAKAKILFFANRQQRWLLLRLANLQPLGQ